MQGKTKERKKAINLRKEGRSYAEILEEVPVAKSTLSRWLRDVGLSKRQKQRLTDKKKAAIKRNAKKTRQKRIDKTRRIKKEAFSDIEQFTKNDLFLIGVILYWTEGTKEKSYRPSEQVAFCNNDATMIRLFIQWLTDIVGVDRSELVFRIHIHETSQERMNEVREYWSEMTNFPVSAFERVTWKKHNPKTVRKNCGVDYYGMLKVRVRCSADLNRRIAGWIEGVCNQVS